MVRAMLRAMKAEELIARTGIGECCIHDNAPGVADAAAMKTLFGQEATRYLIVPALKAVGAIFATAIH